MPNVSTFTACCILLSLRGIDGMRPNFSSDSHESMSKKPSCMTGFLIASGRSITGESFVNFSFALSKSKSSLGRAAALGSAIGTPGVLLLLL